MDMSEKEEDANESDAVLSDATSDIQMLESDVGSVCDAEDSSMSDAEGPLQEESCPKPLVVSRRYHREAWQFGLMDILHFAMMHVFQMQNLFCALALLFQKS